MGLHPGMVVQALQPQPATLRRQGDHVFKAIVGCSVSSRPALRTYVGSKQNVIIESLPSTGVGWGRPKFNTQYKTLRF